jgi:hypothetical protein
MLIKLKFGDDNSRKFFGITKKEFNEEKQNLVKMIHPQDFFDVFLSEKGICSHDNGHEMKHEEDENYKHEEYKFCFSPEFMRYLDFLEEKFKDDESILE